MLKEVGELGMMTRAIFMKDAITPENQPFEQNSNFKRFNGYFDLDLEAQFVG